MWASEDVLEITVKLAAADADVTLPVERKGGGFRFAHQCNANAPATKTQSTDAHKATTNQREVNCVVVVVGGGGGGLNLTLS